MNSKLVELFSNKDEIDLSSLFISDTAEDIVNKLNKLYPKWVYEIQHEEYMEQDTCYFVTVVVYLPGKIKTGTGRSNVDFNRNHKNTAIYNAIKNAIFFGMLDDTNNAKKEYDDTITRVYNIQNVMQWDNNTLLQAVKSWNNTIKNLSNMNLKSWLQFIKYVNKQYNSNF